MLAATEVLKDNLWQGQPCFVVGSGPSLIGFPFEKLKGKLTIGCNMEFRWNPTISICQDVRFFKAYRNHPDYANANTLRIYFKAHPDREDIECNHAYQIESNLQRWSTSLCDGLVYGAQVGLAALNLADILGASPIYLLGFDCYSLGEVSHHHNEYPKEWRIPDKPSSDKRYQQWADDYKKYSDQIHGYVVNLSEHSRIYCFEKKNWREIL